MKKTGFPLMVVLAAVGLLIAPPLIFLHAPLESEMGFVQKIFYFHVPCAAMMFLFAFVSAGGSIAYLWRGSARGDRIAVAAGELVVLFGFLVLLTGPLWARKAWGRWWVWDVRLTTSLMLWLIFVAYIFARQYGGPAARRLAAGLAIFGAADVPLIYVSVNIWRTIHPNTQVVRTLDPGMRLAFWVSFAAIALLGALLFWLRAAIERTRGQVDDLYVAMED